MIPVHSNFPMTHSYRPTSRSMNKTPSFKTVLFKRDSRGKPNQAVILFLPWALIPHIFKEIHGHLLARHDSLKKPRRELPNVTIGPTWMLS
jgi:hypothetical protein